MWCGRRRRRFASFSAPCVRSLPGVEIFNLFGDAWDFEEEQGAFQIRRAGVGRRLRSELIGASLYEIDPGRKLWPYHFHHSNEELLLVVRGRPILRGPDGDRQLEEGDVAWFLRGEQGGHAVRNETNATVRVLMLSTTLMPEILEYPDSGKTGLRDAKGERRFLGRLGEPADYWDGEE
jgi:uncharacterized cupin superfamily protein